VSTATKPIPTTITTSAITRPSRVTGHVSPYPTVVTVTTAHQTPSEVVQSLLVSTAANAAPPRLESEIAALLGGAADPALHRAAGHVERSSVRSGEDFVVGHGAPSCITRAGPVRVSDPWCLKEYGHHRRGDHDDR
jgi:hypothetical protein